MRNLSEGTFQVLYAWITYPIPYSFLVASSARWAKHGYRVGDARRPGPRTRCRSAAVASFFGLTLYNPDTMDVRGNDIVGTLPGQVKLFTESHIPPESFPGLKRFWRGHKSEAFFGGTAKGKLDGRNRQYRYETLVSAVSHLPARDNLLGWPSAVWRTGRVLDLTIQVSNSITLGILLVYAHSGSDVEDREQRELLLSQVMDAADRMKAGPKLIAGDFNTVLSESEILQQMRHVGWIDLAEAHAQINGYQPQPTCFQSQDSPTRIDQIWANAEAYKALQSIQVLNDVKDTIHRPVYVRFAFQP